MALNLISNYAANVAHRQLTATDMQATSSLAKLSSGTRVVSAKDDAAAMAIGSRISSEVAALRQASVNAGQAVSMRAITKIICKLWRRMGIKPQHGEGGPRPYDLRHAFALGEKAQDLALAGRQHHRLSGVAQKGDLLRHIQRQ